MPGYISISFSTERNIANKYTGFIDIGKILVIQDGLNSWGYKII